MDTRKQQCSGRSHRRAGQARLSAVLLLVFGLPALPTQAQQTAPISPDQICVGQPEGTACWMELENQAECYVWNGQLKEDQSVTWSGACVGGLAHGEGSLTWVWGENKSVRTAIGLLQDGQRHGRWVFRWPNGAVSEGSFVDGQQHGLWVERLANGSVFEGPFVSGQRHGPWVLRGADGTVSEGPFINGQRHGHWVLRWPDGRVAEGPFINGQQHGLWVLHHTNGAAEEVTYVNGKRQ